MRSILIGSLLALLVAGSAEAQLAKQWVRHHNGGGNSEDYGRHAATDSEGNVYLTGQATNAAGEVEMLTVKYDQNGSEQWARTYPAAGGGPDFGQAIAIDGAGNAIVAGDSVGVGGDYDIVVLKYSSSGTLLWSQRYDGPGGSFDAMQAPNLALDGNGDVIVGGTSIGVGTYLDAVVLKYSSAGALLWEARHGDPTYTSDGCYGLQVDAAGNVHAMTWTVNPASSYDIVTLKYDPDGALLWEQQYDGPAAGEDFGYSILLDSSANVLVTGYSAGVGSGNDVVTIKYDPDGGLLWAQRYNGSANRDDYGLTLATNDLGFVAVTGTSESPYHSPATTLLYDASGNLFWTRTFETSDVWVGNGSGLGCAFDADGNLFVGVWGWGGPPVGHAAFLVEYAQDGTLLFEDQHDSVIHADDIAFLASLDGAGNVVLVGYSQRGSQQVDTLLIKYGAKTKIAPVAGPPEDEDPIQPLLQATPRKPAHAQLRSVSERLPEPLKRLPLSGGRSLR